MKFSISSKQLQHDLAIAAKVIQKKNAMAILDYARVSQQDEKFYLTGASSYNQLTVEFDLRQTDGGKFTPFCIDANQFLAILGTLPEQPIDIVVEEEKNFLTTIYYEGGEFSLASMSAVDFPNRADLKEDKTVFSLPSNILLPCVKAAMVCTKDDPLRPVMGAVAIDATHEGTTFVGTNGAALYKYVYAHGAPFLTEGEPSVLLLHRAIISAIESMVDKSETVDLQSDGHHIRISTDKAVLVASAIEGRYPNYNGVIPTNNPYHVSFSVRDLIMAVKRVSLMSSTATNLLVLEKKNGAMSLKSSDIDFGRAAQSAMATDDCTLPDGFRIGMKAETLLLTLGNIASEKVRFHFSAADKPIVVFEDVESSALTEILMPILIE